MVGPNSASTNQAQMTRLLSASERSGSRKPSEVVVSDLAPRSSIG